MIAKYQAKYGTSAMSAARVATAALATAGYTAHAIAWAPYEASTREVLNAQGISVAHGFGYFAFSQQLYGASRTWSGETLILEAANLVVKYTAWGLSPSVLAFIRSQVYTIPAPV